MGRLLYMDTGAAGQPFRNVLGLAVEVFNPRQEPVRTQHLRMGEGIALAQTKDIGESAIHSRVRQDQRHTVRFSVKQ